MIFSIYPSSPEGRLVSSAMSRRIVAVIGGLTALMLAVLVGCGEIATSARLDRGPTFLLDGSGRLASFRIYGPQTGHRIGTPFDAKSLVWCVQPTAGYFEGIRVHRLALNFGIVPAGYAQIVPAGGIVPKLPSKVVYYFLAETTDAPPAAGFFYQWQSHESCCWRPK